MGCVTTCHNHLLPTQGIKSARKSQLVPTNRQPSPRPAQVGDLATERSVAHKSNTVVFKPCFLPGYGGIRRRTLTHIKGTRCSLSYIFPGSKWSHHSENLTTSPAQPGPRSSPSRAQGAGQLAPRRRVEGLQAPHGRLQRQLHLPEAWVGGAERIGVEWSRSPCPNGCDDPSSRCTCGSLWRHVYVMILPHGLLHDMSFGD